MIKSQFLNMESAGCYDSFSHFIKLNASTKDSIEHFIKGIITKEDFNLDDAESLSVLAHELRHWIDHIATYCGVDSLEKQFQAIEAKLLNDVHLLHRIKKYANLLEAEAFINYYTTVNSEYHYMDKSDRWVQKYTSGHRFDYTGKPDEQSPILFSVFYDSSLKQIARAPITLASFYEINAKSEEFMVQSIYYAMNPSEISAFEKKLCFDLYNPHLTVYSSVVHTFANEFGIKDIACAYKYASMLSSFILNLDEPSLLLIPVPEVANETWPERVPYFRNNADRAFGYFSMLHAFKSFDITPFSKDDYDALLTKLGMPSIGQMESQQLQRYDSMVFNCPREDLNRYFSTILEEGRRIFSNIGVLGESKGSLNILCNSAYLPPIFYSDSAETEMQKNSWISFSQSLLPHLEEFTSICGV